MVLISNYLSVNLHGHSHWFCFIFAVYFSLPCTWRLEEIHFTTCCNPFQRQMMATVQKASNPKGGIPSFKPYRSESCHVPCLSDFRIHVAKILKIFLSYQKSLCHYTCWFPFLFTATNIYRIFQSWCPNGPDNNVVMLTLSCVACCKWEGWSLCEQYCTHHEPSRSMLYQSNLKVTADKTLNTDMFILYDVRIGKQKMVLTLWSQNSCKILKHEA